MKEDSESTIGWRLHFCAGDTHNSVPKSLNSTVQILALQLLDDQGRCDGGHIGISTPPQKKTVYVTNFYVVVDRLSSLALLSVHKTVKLNYDSVIIRAASTRECILLNDITVLVLVLPWSSLILTTLSTVELQLLLVAY